MKTILILLLSSFSYASELPKINMEDFNYSKKFYGQSFSNTRHNSKFKTRGRAQQDAEDDCHIARDEMQERFTGRFDLIVAAAKISNDIKIISKKRPACRARTYKTDSDSSCTDYAIVCVQANYAVYYQCDVECSGKLNWLGDESILNIHSNAEPR